MASSLLRHRWDALQASLASSRRPRHLDNPLSIRDAHRPERPEVQARAAGARQHPSSSSPSRSLARLASARPPARRPIPGFRQEGDGAALQQGSSSEDEEDEQRAALRPPSLGARAPPPRNAASAPPHRNPTPSSLSACTSLADIEALLDARERRGDLLSAREAAEMAAALARLLQRRQGGVGGGGGSASPPPATAADSSLPVLMSRLAAHVSRGIDHGHATADDVALALWAHAKLRLHPGRRAYRQWCAALVRAALQRTPCSAASPPPPPDDVSLVQALWATAQLRDPLPPAALSALLSRALAPRLGHLSSHGLSSALWALAAAEAEPGAEFLGEFWRACLSPRRPLRAGALPQAHANLLYAAARLAAGGGGGGGGQSGGGAAAAAPRRSFLSGGRRAEEDEEEDEVADDDGVVPSVLDDDDSDDPLDQQQQPGRRPSPPPPQPPPNKADPLLLLPPDAWIREVLEASWPSLGRWGPQDAANALWALARLQRARRRRRLRRRRQLEEQEGGGGGDNDDPHEEEDPSLEPLCARWIDGLVRSVASSPERLARFRGGELAQLLWALAELRVAPPRPNGRLLLAAALRWRRPAAVGGGGDGSPAPLVPPPHMRVGEWAVLLRAAALLQRCESAADELAAAAAAAGEEGGADEAAPPPSNSSPSTSSLPPLITEAWLREAQSAVLAKLRFGDAPDLTVTLWALAAAATGLARRARAQQQREKGDDDEAATAIAPTPSPRPQLDPTRPYYYAPRSLFRERWFAESHSRLFFFEPRHTAAALWALARLRWRPPLAWSDRLFLETFSRLPDAGAGEIASMMRSLAALRVRPPVQWAAAAAGASALRLREGPPFVVPRASGGGGGASPSSSRGAGLLRRGASLRDALRLVQGMTALRYRPPDRWFEALRARLAMEEEDADEEEEEGGGGGSASGRQRRAAELAALKEAVRRLRRGTSAPATGRDTIAGRATYGGFG